MNWTVHRLSLFFISTLVPTLLSLGCSLSMCGNQILSTTPASDGAVTAVVFVRDCGATTGVATEVSILSSGIRLPNDGGNVLIAGDNHGRAHSGPGNVPKVDVKWTGARELLVVYEATASITKVAQSVGGVTVHFQEQVHE